ncbi:MAG TPA: hypothetical protein PKC84_06550, partial [Paracoccaceae bacterium]|nr:hypothetical protein [Paracoccaceae bacterium]
MKRSTPETPAILREPYRKAAPVAKAGGGKPPSRTGTDALPAGAAQGLVLGRPGQQSDGGESGESQGL